MIEERNARIERTRLFVEDHGMLTAFLYLDYGNGLHQGFGGYALYLPSGYGDCGGKFVYSILKTIEQDSWDDLKDKIVRVRIENGLVRAIGHPIKDQWFAPGDELKELT